MKGDEMARSCSMHGDIKSKQNFGWKVEGKRAHKKLGVCESIVLKWMLRK
jgi:hypothetical protein